MKRYTVHLAPYSSTFESTSGEIYTDYFKPFDVVRVCSEGPVTLEKLPIVLERIRNNTTNYPEFLQEAAQLGVHHYVIDFEDFKAKYYSENEANVYIEAFPEFFKTL